MDRTTLVKATLAIALSTTLCGCSILPYFIGEVDDNNTSKTSVVIVGVENGYAGRCPGSLKDANSMKSMLSKHSSDVVVLVDSGATTSNVSTAIQRALKSQFAIIYFSGHGGSQPGSIDEADGNDEFICCYDGALLDDAMWEMLCQASGRVFLMFDCCHSETMFKSPSFQFSQASQNARILKSGHIPDMLCWSGCPDDSYSYGTEDGGELTRAVLHYGASGSSYSEVWRRVSSDYVLKSQQTVKQTKLGSFDTNQKVFTQL